MRRRRRRSPSRTLARRRRSESSTCTRPTCRLTSTIGWPSCPGTGSSSSSKTRSWGKARPSSWRRRPSSGSPTMTRCRRATRTRSPKRSTSFRRSSRGSQSYAPGLNANWTRIREGPADYFRNIVSRGDGSILEQSAVSFGICHVSRITTHELVRHRVGTAVSQESLRYVRPTEIGFWIPDELNPEQRKAMEKAVAAAEKAYRELEAQVPWEKMTMDQKKRLTSAIRRILPDGLATNLIWTANHRTLRWVIEMRTDPSAE